jgi:hypothetical protein
MFNCPPSLDEAVEYVQSVGLIVLIVAFCVGYLIGSATGKMFPSSKRDHG